MVHPRTATAADFDHAANNNARAFWLWLVVAGLVWWLTSLWWAAVPSLIGAWCAYNSVACTRTASKLRNGTYPIPNINNGAPDGDASNWDRGA